MSAAQADTATLWKTRFLPRRDLKFTRCADQHDTWNAFDPITRQSVRVGLLEYLLLNRVDGRKTLGQLTSNLVDEHASVAASALADAAAKMRATGLLKTTRVEASLANHIRTFQQVVSSFVVWQVRGINPDSILRGIAPGCSFLFSATAVKFWSVMMLATFALVCADFVRLCEQAATWQSLLAGASGVAMGGWLLLVFLATRALHELGHAIVCYRQGIRCPDIGLLFIMCAPCVYCDVSESWRLPRRSQRAAVAAGGMYVELVVATIAAWVWFLTVQSPINTLALQTMCVCSISTVIINANPLMRFDGYYILADWLDEVNLRSKADRLLGTAIANAVLGNRQSDETSAAHALTSKISPSTFLMLFSAAGWVYRSLLSLAIAGGVVMLWSNWNLTWIGRSMAIAILFSWWCIPIIGFAKTMTREAILRRRRFRLGLVAAAVVMVVAFLPIPTRRWATGWLRAKQMTGVYAPETALLVDCHAQDGAIVEEGQPLFQFRDSILEAQQHSSNAEVQTAAVNFVSMRMQRDKYGQDVDLTKAETRMETLDTLAQESLRRWQRLKITSPAAGTLVVHNAPAMTELADGTSERATTPEFSALWSEPQQLGRLVPSRTLLASIRGSEFSAVVPLSDKQLADVSAGTTCRLRIFDAQRSVVESTVDRIIPLDSFAQSTAASADRDQPSPGQYAAIVHLPDDMSDRFCDEAVDVVFHTSSTSIYELASDWLRSNLRFLSD